MIEFKYAKVIIQISHENVDRPFTYLIPDELREKIDLGTSVIVPFGVNNRSVNGFIVDFCNQADFDPSKIKPVTSICEKSISLSEQRIRLAAWMKKNYGSTMIQALKTVLPVKEKIKAHSVKTIVRCVSTDTISEEIEVALKKKNVARLRLLYALLDNERLPKTLVDEKLHISASTIKKLVENGIICIEENVDMPKVAAKEGLVSNSVVLSSEQAEVANTVRDDLANGISKTYLIHGITGSGKTEVYMQIIADVISMGKQAIVLIPEIALTYQTLMRFYNRFGDRVSIMNSTLSKGEKYELFSRAEKGLIDVVIGPRSALFTPFTNLGVIVIDEEHEGTYKSETMPKYHARETAVYLARMNNAAVVLGSATPSIDAYYRCETGEYTLFKMTRRLTGNQLPNVYVADLRKELREGNRSILSRKLQELIEDRLNKNEQVMLFLNRRGVAGFISCRACGFVVKCPHCDVSLSLHANGRMECHYCGYSMPQYEKCPECGSKYILGFKAGTEQIEQTINKMYPRARTLRMDADTTKEKESYEKILSAFLDKEADILIGTQMIVKGHDFKNVTLVGVLAADMSLFANDFRAPERTFQLLTQAAGRAGRGETPGEVVIQTYQPEHYCIQYAINQDYEGFYEQEIGFRELLDYPPAGHMLSILITSAYEERAKALSDKLALLINETCKIRVIGPARANVGKINDVYRYVIYIKNKDYERLVEVKDMTENYLSDNKHYSETVYFDFDPQNII